MPTTWIDHNKTLLSTTEINYKNLTLDRNTESYNLQAYNSI